MRTVSVIESSRISRAVCDLYGEINLNLREDVLDAIRRAAGEEQSAVARDVLQQLLENQQISRTERLPLCQDTGLAVAFVEMGQGVIIEGGNLAEAIASGVREAQSAYALRASVVRNPLERDNTGDNTPPVVHLEQVPGDNLTIHLMAKGGGAENMSRLFMLSPAAGREGVAASVVQTVREAGANACPPLLVGVGLGGDFERAPLLAKRALLRRVGQRNSSAPLAALEDEVLDRINELGIGPLGLGGRTTALAVMIEQCPCHIASLPLAVNLACHSHRHGTVTLHGERRAI